jgi:hypothetical protein
VFARYVLPAVESLCRSCGGGGAGAADASDDAAAAATAAALPPAVVVLKHCLRDEYDERTDLARLHRVRAAPAFACFVGGALVDIWHGGNRRKLEAALARWGPADAAVTAAR